MDSRLCPHCNESVSLNAHRRMYYDSINGHIGKLLRNKSRRDNDGPDLASKSPPHSVGVMRQFPNSPVCDPFQGMK